MAGLGTTAAFAGVAHPAQRPRIAQPVGAAEAHQPRIAWQTVTSKISGCSICVPRAWSLDGMSPRVSGDHRACSTVSQVLTETVRPLARFRPDHVALITRQPPDGRGQVLPHFARGLVDPGRIYSGPRDTGVHGRLDSRKMSPGHGVCFTSNVTLDSLRSDATRMQHGTRRGGRVRSTLSFRAKRELLVQVAPRYRAARHGQRSVILDEFVAVTGYDRKYAIRLLLGPVKAPQPIRRPRAAQLWSSGSGSAGERVDGREWHLWQAPGAVPARTDPHPRTARPPESVRRGPPAGCWPSAQPPPIGCRGRCADRTG